MVVAVEKLPPHDIDAEEAVIASLLVDGEAIFKVAPILREPDDFFREKNRWAYEACLSLWERGEAINQITLAHELARRGRLEELGGVAYLSRLVTELPTPLGVEYYAQIVQRDAVYRRLIDAAGKINQMGYQGGADLGAALARAEGLLAAVRGEKLVSDFVHIRELLERHVEAAAGEGVEAAAGHIRSGFMDMDTLLGGLKRSDLVILAARPSLGKTSLALNIARNAAVGQQATVAIFSLETAGEQLAQRLLAAESNVDSTRLRLGTHSEAEERRIMQAMGVLADANIFVDDSAVLRMAEMRGKAWRLSREHRLDLVIVDYLQLMHGGVNAENRVQEISYISRSLKELARELSVPVIAVSQLSRAVEARATHIPVLSDLRESGSIEQDADVVLFIYREDVYMRKDEWQRMHPDRPGDSYPAGIVQIIVAKHRNGPTGTIHLRFREKVARFEDLLVQEPEDWP
jgi:replicative DNA helicase